MKRAIFPFRRPRLVHAVLLGLFCTAIAVPLLSNLAPQNGTVEVKRGFVTAIRPIDRLLTGNALGSRKLTPAKPTTSRATLSPRIAIPARMTLPVVDDAPDLRFAALLPTPEPQAPIATVAAVKPAKPLYTEPRRKPPRPAPARPVLKPVADSVASTLPVVIETTELAPLAPLPVEEAVTTDTAPRIPGAPRIALVVTAAGIHEATTRKAIDSLPSAITLAFAPIGKKTGDLARAARADGHTILAEIPMEPMNPRRDPGEPLTLRVANTGPDNLARLDKALARVPGASGISSYLGAKFSRSDIAASPVIDGIGARDLFLFENQPSGQSRLRGLANARNIPYAASTVAIDIERDTTSMMDRLSTLEAQARRDGIAIGVATTYRDTIATLEDWIVKAQKRGIVFVPVTRIDDAG